MGSILKKIQPAVKQETKKVAISTGIGVLLMWLVFVVLHLVMPQKVPFDYTVIAGGAIGGFVAVLNFFLMGIAVQSVAASNEEDAARAKMRSSYSQRMMMQMLWGIVAIVFPCFHFVAGLLPLLFPSIGIKVMNVRRKN